MGQNYLIGSELPKINAMLVATGWDLNKLMKKSKQKRPWPYFSFVNNIKTLLNQDQFDLNFG